MGWRNIPEEVPVDLSVRKVISRNVGEEAHSFVNVVGVRVFHDLLCKFVLARKESFVFVEGHEIGIHHLGVISNANLEIISSLAQVINLSIVD